MIQHAPSGSRDAGSCLSLEIVDWSASAVLHELPQTLIRIGMPLCDQTMARWDGLYKKPDDPAPRVLAPLNRLTLGTED